jgi:Uncharacterized protein involved in exopolysaccharide biosynthesis
MVDYGNGVEVLPGPRGAGGVNRATGPSHRRVRVFLVTLILALAAGLAWDFLRPPLYRASATLLTVAPPELDQPSAEADVQHVAIQRQRLLSRKVLEAVSRALPENGSGEPPVDADRLRAMLQVLSVPDTNLVELRADGTEPLFLSAVVNAWIDAYLSVRAEEVAALEAGTSRVLRERYQALGRKIEEKRAALERFRERHSILSTARDENQVLARLKGLNDSLNAANEERVKARARLDAIEAAIARGETLVPEEDKRSYAEMVKRAQELREQVAELQRRYTDEYIERSPALKVIPEKLARLEQKLRRYREESRAHLLATARQEHAAAVQTVAELEGQLESLKREASEFTARFSEYEAMQEDLANLEALYRELEDRLVKVEISNRKKYPQVQVVEWAYPPAAPVWPHYWRDAAIVAGASVVLALLMVWLVEFLRPAAPPVQPALGVTLYPANPALGQGEAERAALEQRPQALPARAVVELAPGEIRQLVEHGDPIARQLVGLLLSGLSVQEILQLEAEDIDPETGEVEVRGRSARKVRLPPAIRSWYLGEEGAWLAWKEQEGFDEGELEARLQLAAREAGIPEIERVDSEALRNSYLLHLVRQGVRLTDLERVVGAMPARQLLELGAHAPGGPSRPVSEVDTVYPLFA